MKTCCPLTPRECQVVEMLALGCTYDRAAQRLGISLHTVVTHVKNAYRKLDVHTSGAAVMRAVELGLIGEQREAFIQQAAPHATSEA